MGLYTSLRHIDSVGFLGIPMHAEIFTLCSVGTLVDQRLCILHTFENFYAAESPVRFSGTCVLKLRFDQLDEGNHNFAIKVIDQDGGEISSFPFSVSADLTDIRSYQYTALVP